MGIVVHLSFQSFKLVQCLGLQFTVAKRFLAVIATNIIVVAIRANKRTQTIKHGAKQRDIPPKLPKTRKSTRTHFFGRLEVIDMIL